MANARNPGAPRSPPTGIPISTQYVGLQHKNVVQVLWLVVQVLVQSEEVQVAVAPPATPSK
jgi:hypothetical protein